LCVVLCRTLETTNSECDLETDYTKFKTVAEAKVALLNVGLGKYAKVTQPKENLCIFFGPFQSVQSDELRVVLCGGNPINLLQPTKFFRDIVGPPSRKGYFGTNMSYFLNHISNMGILCKYLFERIDDTYQSLPGHDDPDKDNELVEDTSFHLRSIFWDDSTIGFTYLLFGNIPCFSELIF
jgi:hypothetical protein